MCVVGGVWGVDECSEFLANSQDLHSLNLYSLFPLLANLQTLQKNTGVEVFLKYNLSKVDFYICFFPYKPLGDNGIFLTVFPNFRQVVLSADSDLGHT